MEYSSNGTRVSTVQSEQERSAESADLETAGGRRLPGVRRKLTGALAAAGQRGEQVTGASVRTAGRGVRVARRGASVASRGVQAAGRGARAAGRGARWSTALLVDQVLERAPRLPVRDRATLRAQFPGHTPEELAEALIEGAARISAGVGAAAGTLAALPFPLVFPADLAAEALTVIAIEIKLVAELHEVFGVRVPGSGAERMTAYAGAWANRRGISMAPGGLVLAVGSPLRRRLQRRLAVRAGQGAVALGPLLTGAVAAAMINRYETRRLGRDIRDDLRKRSPNTAQWPD